jgi:hypothetical protein
MLEGFDGTTKTDTTFGYATDQSHFAPPAAITPADAELHPDWRPVVARRAGTLITGIQFSAEKTQSSTVQHRRVSPHDRTFLGRIEIRVDVRGRHARG